MADSDTIPKDEGPDASKDHPPQVMQPTREHVTHRHLRDQRLQSREQLFPSDGNEMDYDRSQFVRRSSLNPDYARSWSRPLDQPRPQGMGNAAAAAAAREIPSYCNLSCICIRFVGICIVVGVVMWLLSYVGLIQYDGPSLNLHVPADVPLVQDGDDYDYERIRRILEDRIPKYLVDDIQPRNVKRMEPEDIQSVLRDLPLLKKMRALLEMRSNTNFVAHPELTAPEPLSFIVWATNRKQTKQETNPSFSWFGLAAEPTKQTYEVVFMFNARVAGESEETTPMVLPSNWRPQFFGPLGTTYTPKVIEVAYETIQLGKSRNDFSIITMHRWFEMEEAADLLNLMDLCRPKDET